MASVLNEAIESEGIPNYHGDVSLEVRVVDREEDAGLHTCIVPSPGSRHASIDAILPLARLIAGLETTVGVLYRHNQDLPQLLYGESVGNLSVSGHSFALSAATFFQTNLVLLPALLHNVVAAAEARPTDTVVDVYGGVGIFGLLLAPSVQRVVEIEIDPVGIECARRSAQDQGLTNVDFLSGTAESILSEVGNANIVVVDPPRAGLTPKVIQAIGVMRPERILYVSCLAKSLARDLVSFGEFGYTSSGIDLFDFYPQTPHVELFTLLRR